MGAGTQKKIKYTFKKRKRRFSADPASFDTAVDLVLAGKPLTRKLLKALDAGRNDYLFMLSLERQDESSSAIFEKPARLSKRHRGRLLDLVNEAAILSAGFALAAVWVGTASCASKEWPKKRKKKERKKGKGGGRRGPGDFPNAKTVKVSHPTLGPGDPCPTCDEGRVYLLSRLGLPVPHK